MNFGTERSRASWPARKLSNSPATTRTHARFWTSGSLFERRAVHGPRIRTGVSGTNVLALQYLRRRTFAEIPFSRDKYGPFFRDFLDTVCPTGLVYCLRRLPETAS
jgi:hypothetical protein